MSIVMGTAGHIDHGKTSLIKALTGTDCDRLEEEKKRGITIELGFAYMRMADGSRLGIVDVPGHERFIRNMVAGASGIDFVLMVIAADEGVMPQTREHLEICSLMGIREGMIALTKADMVEADMLELAREDVADSLKGTFLEGAPIYPVSSVTGEGLDELRRAILERASGLKPRHHSDIFRLPVDRVFSIKGHGTIVTGTLVSGKTSPDDEVEIVPAGIRSRVKNIQTHGEDVKVAVSGHRTSINLGGLEVKDIHKGDLVAHPGTLFPSTRWLVALTCLPSSPRGLKQREELHFHHGTREVKACLYFPDRDMLMPGDRCLAEVRFETPMAGVFGDHCVVRLFSPLRTAAGGVLIVPVPFTNKLRKIPEDMVARLLEAPDAEPEARVLTQVEFAGAEGVNWQKLAALTCLEEKKMDKAVQALTRQHLIFCFHKDSRSYVSASALEFWKRRFMVRASEFHAQNPLQQGMSRGWLLTGIASNLSQQMGLFVLGQLVKEGALVAEADLYRRADFTVQVQGSDGDLAELILKAHRETPRTPPMMRHFLEAEKLTAKQLAPVMKMLLQKGELVKISEDLYYDAATLEEIKDAVRVWFDSNTDLTPTQFKDVAGLTRKHAMPLLEYFDNSHFTVRIGNERKLRRA